MTQPTTFETGYRSFLPLFAVIWVCESNLDLGPVLDVLGMVDKLGIASVGFAAAQGSSTVVA